APVLWKKLRELECSLPPGMPEHDVSLTCFRAPVRIRALGTDDDIGEAVAVEVAGIIERVTQRVAGPVECLDTLYCRPIAAVNASELEHRRKRPPNGDGRHRGKQPEHDARGRRIPAQQRANRMSQGPAPSRSRLLIHECSPRLLVVLSVSYPYRHARC